MLALWDTSPWVYVALLRGAAASASGVVRWAGPPVQAEGFVQALAQPWGRTRQRRGRARARDGEAREGAAHRDSEVASLRALSAVEAKFREAAACPTL